MSSRNRFEVFLSDSEDEIDEVVYEPKLETIVSNQKLINYQKFRSCTGNCCNSNSSFYRCKNNRNPKFFTQAYEKLFDLILNIVNETSVDELHVLPASQFNLFFSRIEKIMRPNFKIHKLTSGKKDLFVTYNTWLNHGLDEKSRILVTTCDPTSDVLLEKIRNILKDMQGSYSSYKNSSTENQIKVIETIIREFYNDYLKILACRFKFFDNFQQLRNYVNAHQSKINKLKK